MTSSLKMSGQECSEAILEASVASVGSRGGLVACVLSCGSQEQGEVLFVGVSGSRNDAARITLGKLHASQNITTSEYTSYLCILFSDATTNDVEGDEPAERCITQFLTDRTDWRHSWQKILLRQQ